MPTPSFCPALATGGSNVAGNKNSPLSWGSSLVDSEGSLWARACLRISEGTGRQCGHLSPLLTTPLIQSSPSNKYNILRIPFCVYSLEYIPLCIPLPHLPETLGVRWGDRYKMQGTGQLPMNKERLES